MTNLSAKTHTIVICVHNAVDDVRNCAESLFAIAGDLHEIIFVDDASEAPTIEYLEEIASRDGVKTIRSNERLGYTKSANLGLKVATGDILTLLNSDTIVASGWSRKTVEAFLSSPELGVLGPLSNAASTQSVPSTTGTTGQTAINLLPDGLTVEELDNFCEIAAADLPVPYVPLVHGFCMSITRECLIAVGYFDEISFPLGYGEENDFCLRVTDAGFMLGILLTTYVYHAKSKSYAADERVSLMKSGWEALVAKHGKLRLARSIKIMEAQPSLVFMRKAVEEQYYTKRSNRSSVSDVSLPEKAETEVRAIAFYLPQFHPIPFNDKTWGEGFTEWRNVVRAKPRFPNHAQPKLPGQLGFYDLRRTNVMRAQAEIALQYGVHGVCMYYYRLGGRRLLNTPPDSLLIDPSIKMNFCYCWANESWTRAWDGNTSDVLLTQEYDDATFWGIVNDLVEAADDKRYIRMGGRPVFIIYQAAEVPDAERWVNRLRREVNRLSGQDFLIGSNFSVNFNPSMFSFVDFIIQFPPHRIPRNQKRITIPPSIVDPFDLGRKDYYESYDDVVSSSLSSVDGFKRQFMGVCPDWDNTPRRSTNAHTLIGSTPSKFAEWVRRATEITKQKFALGDIPGNYIFVNAWNEWAEGAVLEPSLEHDFAYLSALRDGLGG